MSNLVFAWPYAIIALLLWIPLWWFDHKHGRDQGFLISPMTGAMKAILEDGRGRRFYQRANWFLTIIWLLLVFSLMRPQLVGEPVDISRDGRNIMLVLDLSESMEAQDMDLAGGLRID